MSAVTMLPAANWAKVSVSAISSLIPNVSAISGEYATSCGAAAGVGCTRLKHALSTWRRTLSVCSSAGRSWVKRFVKVNPNGLTVASDAASVSTPCFYQHDRRYVCAVTEGSGQAPAGWYNDPHSPDRMRYFDGEMWTNHFHQPGKLPDIGSWLSSTFSVFANSWQGAAIVAMIVNLAGSLVIWGGLWFAARDVAIVNEELVNFDSSTGLLIAIIVVAAILWQGFGWLAMSRYLHVAHYQANPTVADAFAHALRRLPRYLGVMFMLVAAAVMAMLVLVGITALVPALGIFLLILALPFAVWAAIKLAFVINAVAIAPVDTSAVRASADVSAGRFWAVFGRVLLFTLVLGITVNIVSATLGQYGQLIDAEALSLNFEVRNDTLVVQNFALRDLLPSSGQFLTALIISSVIQAASGLLSTSAFVRLYLDSGAPSDAVQLGEA